MDLSIIIPSYNRKDLLRYTLDSLNHAKHQNLECEIIVIDDGSSDGTGEMVLREYHEAKLLHNEGKGAAMARNTGLKASNGKYVLYLDSDDLVGENALLEKVQFLDKHQEYQACYGDYEYFNSAGTFTNESIIFKHKYSIVEESAGVNGHLVNYLKGSYIPSNAIIWRRDFLMKIGGHDPELLINQDVDLFIRALLNGLKIGYLPDGCKVYVRHHESDVRVGTANNVIKAQQMLQLRKRFYQHLLDRSYVDEAYFSALSFNVFTEWRRLRDAKSIVAPEFLAFSKKIYWPVEVEESFLLKIVSKLFGPDNAVRTKYFLFKRNF